MTEVNKPPRLGGWTRFVTARPRLSLLVALVLTALAVLAGSGVADRLGSGGWEDPTAESTYATKALEREFPASQPNLLLLVGSGRSSVDDPAVTAEARRITTRLAGHAGAGAGGRAAPRPPGHVHDHPVRDTDSADGDGDGAGRGGDGHRAVELTAEAASWIESSCCSVLVH